MKTRTFKVYGLEGHRQRESFCDSYSFKPWVENIELVEVFNHDVTGTNEYTIVKITGETDDDIEWELEGQLTDGIFENSNTGRIEEVSNF